jgi:hypothetical protein
MHRLWRFCAALAAFAALASPVAPLPVERRPASVTTDFAGVPVPLDRRDPERRELGPLRFIAGWALSSSNRRLGGISAMHVADGQVGALTDAGDLLRFPAPPEPDGFALEIAGRMRIDALRQGPGSPENKIDRDTEAMVIAGSSAWVTFEHHNEVWRYRLPGWQAEARSEPPAMADWPDTRGAEAMTRLPDGRFLIMSESRGQDGASPALLFQGDPAEPGTRAVPIRFRRPSGYRITDVGVLPDGRLLLVVRGIRWNLTFPVKLLVGRLPAQAGGEIETQEVAALEPPLASDNFEALSITQEQGRTMIWLASDDNTTPLQRTLLLKFEWVGETPAP